MEPPGGQRNVTVAVAQHELDVVPLNALGRWKDFDSVRLRPRFIVPTPIQLFFEHVAIPYRHALVSVIIERSSLGL